MVPIPAAIMLTTRPKFEKKGNPTLIRIPIRYCVGTEEGTRTPTGFPTTPSNWLRRRRLKTDGSKYDENILALSCRKDRLIINHAPYRGSHPFPCNCAPKCSVGVARRIV